MLNQINNNIHSLRKNKTNFFRHNDKQKWYKNLDRYLQQTNRLKTICPIYIKPPTDCLTNISLSLAIRICTIVENENMKEKRFIDLKKTLLEQKYPKSLIEASTLRAREIPLEI